MRHKKTVIAGVALLIGIAAAIPTTIRHLRAAGVLARFADPHDSGHLASFERHAVDEKPFCFAGEHEQLCGRLYIPRGVAHPPGIVLLHGVHWLGIDEPRLTSFANALSAAGVTVFTPPVKELADFRISPASIPTIGLAAQTLHREIGRGPVGVIGFSFAGGLALLAAADRRYTHDIGFVAAIGAHDDMLRVARFFFTDQIQDINGKTILMPAHQYGGGVLAYTKAEEFFPGEAEIARAALRDWLMGENDRLKTSEAKLSPAARARFDLFRSHQFSASMTDLLRIVEESREEMAAVSPHGHLANLHARVYLLHGTQDNVIPATEMDWLASDVPPHLLKAKVLSPAIVHVEPGAKIPMSQELELVDYIADILQEADNQ